jgi:hypothetical protein
MGSRREGVGCRRCVHDSNSSAWRRQLGAWRLGPTTLNPKLQTLNPKPGPTSSSASVVIEPKALCTLDTCEAKARRSRVPFTLYASPSSPSCVTWGFKV